MKDVISWILRVVAAVILGQTLFFKFSGSEESVALFTQLEMEPYGRILIGVLELIAVILLLIPTSKAYGAVLSTGLMTGALIGHVTKLGFAGEMLSLSILAGIVFASSIALLILHRNEVPILKDLFKAEGQPEL